MSTTASDEIREEVRARYAEAALRVVEPAARRLRLRLGCVLRPRHGVLLRRGALLAARPRRAARRRRAASLGCGNPTAVAELREGETVLDLGSGGGIDVLLSARRVGPTGKAYGLDMTDEMLALARRNAAEAGATNVEFLKGEIEAIPLPDASVDVIISNCVINLSTDKPAVLRRDAPRPAAGRPDRRLATSSPRIASPGRRAPSAAASSAASPARSREGEYAAMLRDAGFADVSVTFTHAVADGMHGAIIKAVRPG